MSSLGDRLSAARKAVETDEIDFDDEAYSGQDLVEAMAEEAAAAAEADGPSFTPRHASPTDIPPPPKAAPARPEGGRRALPLSAQDRFEEIKQTVHAELLKQLGPKLYGGEMDVDELDKQVRVVLGDVLAKQ